MSTQKHPITAWLPVSKKELETRGWEQLDIIIVSGDAYVYHTSFGHAVIGRILEKDGYKVAILPQPNWHDDLRDFKKPGAPRLPPKIKSCIIFGTNFFLSRESRFIKSYYLCKN